MRYRRISSGVIGGGGVAPLGGIVRLGAGIPNSATAISSPDRDGAGRYLD